MPVLARQDTVLLLLPDSQAVKIKLKRLGLQSFL